MKGYLQRLKTYSGRLASELLSSSAELFYFLRKVFALTVILILMPVLALIDVEGTYWEEEESEAERTL